MIVAIGSLTASKAESLTGSSALMSRGLVWEDRGERKTPSRMEAMTLQANVREEMRLNAQSGSIE